MRRIFYTLWGAMAAGITIASVVKAGPALEWRLAPITTEQSIAADSVIRLDDGRLCWRRWVAKARNAEPWNFDVFLDRPQSADRTFPEVTDRWDGHSWHTKGGIKAGERKPQDQCIKLPLNLAPGEPVILSQTIHYPGFQGWWDLPVALPIVTYRAPVDPSHDFAPPP